MKERSEASHADVPDATARNLRRAALLKRLIVSVLLLTTLSVVAILGFGAVRTAARAREVQARAEARRVGAARDRDKFDDRGVLLLGDARNPGGPTWGISPWADLEVVDGTNIMFFGPHGHPEDPRTRSYIVMNVKNKSEQAWNDVTVDISFFDGAGKFEKTVGYKIGTIKPGFTRRKTCGPLDGGMGMYRLLGFRGQAASPATVRSAAQGE